MTEVVALVAFGSVGIGLFYLMLFGFDRMLRDALKSELEPIELVSFESQANRFGAGWTALFSFHNSRVLVTNLRLLTSWWVLAPFWKTIKSVPIRDVTSVATVSVLRMPQFHIRTTDNQFVISLMRNSFWPFPRDGGRGFIDALRSGSDAHFTETSGLNKTVRSQIEPKQ